MEKDVDEVGSIARFIKGKLEELDREVLSTASSIQFLNLSLYFYMSISFKSCRTWQIDKNQGVGKDLVWIDQEQQQHCEYR